jgi:hypothetical protein
LEYEAWSDEKSWNSKMHFGGYEESSVLEKTIPQIESVGEKYGMKY